MKKCAFLLSLLFAASCIPLRVAPSIKDYKVTSGKRFKRGLPKKTTFIFEDPKDANEFYSYINIKFGLDDHFVDVEVPFELEGKEYYFSFYEVEINDKALNLLPIAIDVAAHTATHKDEFEPFIATTGNTILREGNWYIAMEVFSKTEKDCLAENSVSKEVLLPYLRDLKEEYLSTHNYNEVVFKN